MQSKEMQAKGLATGVTGEELSSKVSVSYNVASSS